MNKRTICLAVVGIMAVGYIGGGFFNKGKKPTEDTPSSAAASSVAESEIQNNAPIEENDEFKLMEFGDTNTMVGRADYFALGWIADQQNETRDSLKLEKVHTESGPMKSGTGHQIYKSRDDDQNYIISGYSAMKLVDGQVLNKTFLREENTGVRIYVMPNQSAETAFQSAWDSGSRILAGKTKAEKDAIIVDGRLIDAKYTEQDGEIYINLADVAAEVDSSFQYTVQDGKVLIYPNEFCYVEIPTTAADIKQKESFHVVNNTFTFKSWAGEDSFSIDDAPVLDQNTLLISAKDASRMLGWRMYTNGSVLSIVSDPLNVSNKTVVYANGSMGIETRVEYVNGEYVINTYDTTGTLIDTKPLGDLDDVDSDSESTDDSGSDVESQSKTEGDVN